MTPASTSAPAKKAARKAASAKTSSSSTSGKSTSTRSGTAKGAGSGRSAKSGADSFTGNFAGYSKGPYGKAYDEMFDASGEVRPPYRGIYKAFADEEQSDVVEARVEALGRAYLDQGVTFSLSGQERPFPLDIVPRVISAAEWNKLEASITQRVQALELFLDDIYGEQEILRDGVLPRNVSSTRASTSIGRPQTSGRPTVFASTSPAST